MAHLINIFIFVVILLIMIAQLPPVDVQNQQAAICINLGQQLNKYKITVDPIAVYGKSYGTFVGCKLEGTPNALEKANELITKKVIVELDCGYKILQSEFTVNNTLFVFVSK